MIKKYYENGQENTLHQEHSKNCRRRLLLAKSWRVPAIAGKTEAGMA